jgi:acyl-CoA thioester hydrolase
MARIKIKMPENFYFSTVIEVRITDLNYGAHLGNDALLSIVHEARVRFLNSMGYSEFDIDGVGIIMSDAVILYKSQAHYNDRLKIEINAGEFSGKSCDFFYRLSKENDTIVALCKTGIVFYDYQSKKPVAIPKNFLNHFEKTAL